MSVKFSIILAVLIQLTVGQRRYNPCDEVPGGSGFVNDFSSCASYYSCVNYLAFSHECPLPFHYLQLAVGEGICHFPDVANCQRCPPLGVQLIHIPGSCTDYTLCVDGIAADRSCGPGMSFSRQFGTCVREEEVNCLLDIPWLPQQN